MAIAVIGAFSIVAAMPTILRFLYGVLMGIFVIGAMFVTIAIPVAVFLFLTPVGWLILLILSLTGR